MKLKKQEQGFSLPELLVAIAIVGLISTITVVNFRAGQKRDTLEFAGNELKSNIQAAETAAFSGELVQGELPRAYGLNFTEDGNFYIYFAENKESADYVFDEGVDYEIARYGFPDGVSVKTLDFQNIVFLVSRGKILIDGAEEQNSGRIILEHEDISQEKAIIIERISGRIDVSSFREGAN